MKRKFVGHLGQDFYQNREHLVEKGQYMNWVILTTYHGLSYVRSTDPDSVLIIGAVNRICLSPLTEVSASALGLCALRLLYA
jgi:hypothetical protein